MRLIYLPLIVLFFVLNSSDLSAQLNFVPGKIVTKDNQEIQGFIRNDPYQQLTYGISFKLDKKESVKVYRPQELKSFTFADGDHFETQEFTLDDRKINRFLHRLYRGKLSLYELNTSMSRPLYVKDAKGGFHFLCISEDGKDEYLSVLEDLVNDCNKITVPGNLKLNVHDVQTLLLAYNDCTDLPDDFQLDLKSVKIKLQIVNRIGVPLEYHQNDFEGIFHDHGIRFIFPGKSSQFSFTLSWYNFKAKYVGDEISNGESYAHFKGLSPRLDYRFNVKDLFYAYVFTGLKPAKPERVGSDAMRAKLAELHPKTGTLIPFAGMGMEKAFGRHSLLLETDARNFPNLSFGYGFVINR